MLNQRFIAGMRSGASSSPVDASFFFFAAVLVYDISFCRLQTLEVHIYHVKEEAYFELFFFSLLGMFHLNPDVEAVFREVDHGLSMGKGRR